MPYGSDRWDLYFWCNPFTGAAETSERDFSYFTLTFNERQTLEKRRKVCQQVLDLLFSRFQEHPNLDVAVQYSIWFDHPKIHDAVERAKPRLHGLRCIHPIDMPQPMTRCTFSSRVRALTTSSMLSARSTGEPVAGTRCV